jgi:hypothetical protein
MHERDLTHPLLQPTRGTERPTYLQHFDVEVSPALWTPLLQRQGLLCTHRHRHKVIKDEHVKGSGTHTESSRMSASQKETSQTAPARDRVRGSPSTLQQCQELEAKGGWGAPYMKLEPHVQGRLCRLQLGQLTTV